MAETAMLRGSVSLVISNVITMASCVRRDGAAMAWFYLIAAGLCEIVWAVGLKQSNGFTRPVASAVTVVVMLLSFVLLAQAMKQMPLGTSYAIWTGIGAVGTAIVGMVYFHEPKTAVRIACMAMIVLGIIGLKYFAGEGGTDAAQGPGFDVVRSPGQGSEPSP
jgi:quaternary ammonium compound-resistance protein SugE